MLQIVTANGAGAESLKVDGGCNHRAHTPAWSIGGMEIRACHGDQIHRLGPAAPASAQVPVDPGAGDFNRSQAPFSQGLQRRLTEIERRVSESRHPSRGMSDGHRVSPVEPGLGHLSRTVVSQNAGEGIADTLGLAGSHKPIGKVAAAERGPRKGLTERLQIDGEPQGFEPIRHRREPVDSRKPEPRGRGDHRGVLIAKKVAQDMNLPAIQLGRPLDSGNQLDPQPLRLRTGDGQSRNRVMIGNGDGRQAQQGCGGHDLARRANTVGMRGMDMQVGPGTKAGKINRSGIAARLKIRHKRLPAGSRRSLEARQETRYR